MAYCTFIKPTTPSARAIASVWFFNSAIVAGESGGAGLAGLVQVAGDPAMRAQLGLNAASRVLVFNTEGATDPARYLELVGLAAA